MLCDLQVACGEVERPTGHGLHIVDIEARRSAYT